MNKRKKVAWILFVVSIVLIATTFTLIFIEERYFSRYGDSIYAQDIVRNVQNVADSTTYFIEVFPFDDVEYHEIPTSYIYQDGRLRKYASYSDRDSNYYFLEDAKGYFSINTNDTSIIKPYQQAFEIDVFKQSSGMYAAGSPLIFYDGLLWNNFTLSTEGVGCIKVFDLNNILSDSLLFQEDNVKKGGLGALFWEYTIRPYRIFYNEDSKNRDIAKDINETFENVINIFQQHKYKNVKSLTYNTFLPDSNLIKNKYYDIDKDNPYSFSTFSNKLPLASYAQQTAYNKSLEKEYRRRFPKKLYIPDLLLNSTGLERYKFEHSVFQPIDYPVKSKYHKWGKESKYNPRNKFYQYMVVHNDDYDVMYILSDMHYYDLNCWNDVELIKINKIIENIAGIIFLIGLAWLIIAIIQYFNNKHKKLDYEIKM